jgi:general stress protein YciG
MRRSFVIALGILPNRRWTALFLGRFGVHGHGVYPFRGIFSSSHKAVESSRHGDPFSGNIGRPSRLISTSHQEDCDMADQQKDANQGRSGDEKSGGNFKDDPERAAEAGRKGGEASGGNFKNDPERAAEAGRKGGQK